MSLAKHFFAKLRAFLSNNTCLKHALAVIWCACFLPVAWSVAAKMCCLLLLLAKEGCLLLAGLLLLVQLQSLSFSSWTSCWTLVLLLLAWSWASIGLHGFAGCDCVMMCKNWCCSWYGVQGLWCSCVGAVLDVRVLFPLVILIRSTASFASSCGAASSSTQSDDWAACEQPGCVCHSLDLIQPPGRAMKLLCDPLICTPVA
jgi:hypothetical protein